MADGIYEIVEGNGTGKHGLVEAVHWCPKLADDIREAWKSGSEDLMLPQWLARALDGGRFNLGRARIQHDENNKKWFFLKDMDEASCTELEFGDWLVYRRWTAQMYHWKSMGHAKLLAHIPEDEYIPIYPYKPLEKPDLPEHPLNREFYIEGTGLDKGQAHSFTGAIRKVLDPNHPAIGIRREPLSGPYDPDDMPAIFLMNWHVSQEEADRGEAPAPRLVFTKKVTRKDSEAPDWKIATWGKWFVRGEKTLNFGEDPPWIADAKQRGAAIVKDAEKRHEDARRR